MVSFTSVLVHHLHAVVRWIWGLAGLRSPWRILTTAPMEHIEKQFLPEAQSLWSSAGFPVHLHLPKSKWIAWFDRHLFPWFLFFWQLGWSPCFPHNQALQSYMPVHKQCGKNTKVWFFKWQFTSICFQTVPRGPMGLAALQNVSVWRRTPWNAAPKMAVAPANLVTTATDARKVQSDAKFSFFNNNAQPLFSTIWSLII